MTYGAQAINHNRQIAGHRSSPLMTDEGSDGVEPLRGAWVTPNLFNFMGIAPLLGRTAGPAAASQMRRPSSSFGTARGSGTSPPIQR